MKSFRELINKQQPELSQAKAASSSAPAIKDTALSVKYTAPSVKYTAPAIKDTAPSQSPIKRLETQAIVPTTQVSAAQVKPKERYAFAIIHFGSNPVYLELELYFFKMLRQNTSHDILYLYSVNDTPPAFVDAVRPLVTDVIPYDDKHITYDVTFNSGYSNFNTLRTCNFIFAYTLKKYLSLIHI